MKPIKYKTCKIEHTPTTKYPNMVTITKGSRKYKDLLNRKYVELKFAQTAIENIATESLIESGRESGIQALKDITLGIDVDIISY